MLDSFSVFRVRLGYLSSFLSTSCITSLHFIPDSDEGKWYFSVNDFRLYFRRLPIPVFYPGGWGGGVSLIWPIRICAAEQGMVFKVLSLTQGIQFHY